MMNESLASSGLWVAVDPDAPKPVPPEDLPVHADLTWLSTVDGCPGEKLERRCAPDDPEYLARVERGCSYARVVEPHPMDVCPFKDSGFVAYEFESHGYGVLS